MVAVTARLLGQSLTVTSAVVVSVATSMVAIFDAVDSATYPTVPSGAAVTDFAPNSPGIVRTSAPVVSRRRMSRMVAPTRDEAGFTRMCSMAISTGFLSTMRST